VTVRGYVEGKKSCQNTLGYSLLWSSSHLCPAGPKKLRPPVIGWPYLTDVLRQIAAIAPGDTTALEALLPDRWLAAHPEHCLEQREEESREAQVRRRRKRAARRLAVTAARQ
jgi:hypothetical protein